MIQVVGLRAVLDGIGGYLRDARSFDDANRKMGASVDDADRKAQKAAGGISKLGIAIGAAAGTIAANVIGQAAFAVSSQLGSVISDASNLAESISKVDVVFGESAPEIQAWAKTAATAIGQSRQQALEAAGTYGNLFQAFGVGRTEATSMSKSLVELAADLASFNNTSVDDALLALRSGLSGETEPLKKFGVALTDDRLKLEAVKLGLISSVKDGLTPASKSQAAYSLILHDTALAQGDFGRTSAGLANQQRILAASMTNLRARIGTGLLPVVTKIVAFLNTRGLPAFEKLADVLGPRLGAISAALGRRLTPETFRKFAFAGRFALDVLKNLAAIFTTAGRTAAGFVKFVTDVVGAIRQAILVVTTIVGFMLRADDATFRAGLAFAKLPGPLRAIADEARVVVRFIRDMLEPFRDLASRLGAILDPARLAAGGIAGFIAVLALAEALKFAGAVGSIATSFVTWPLKVVRDATTTILDFGRALLGVPSRKVAEEAGQAAGGVADACKDKVVDCVTKPKVDETAAAATRAELDALTKAREVDIKPKTEPKALAGNIGLRLATGIAQGVGAAIGGALVVAIGAGIVAAGIPLAVVALALAAVLVLAIVGFLIFKFRAQIGRFFLDVGKVMLKGFQNIGKVILTGLKNLPEILGAIAALAVAALLLAFIGVPVLLIRLAIQAVRGFVGRIADLGKLVGPVVAGAVAAGLKALPGLFARSFRLGVDGGVREFRALPGQVKAVLDRVLQFVRELPGNIAAILRAIPGLLGDIPGLIVRALSAVREGVPRLFREAFGLIPDIVKIALGEVLRFIVDVGRRFIGSFRDTFAEIDRITDGALSDIVNGARRAFDLIVQGITSLPNRIAAGAFAIFGAAAAVGRAIMDGIRSGVTGAFGVAADIAGAIGRAVVDFVNTNVIDRLNSLLEFDLNVPFGPDIHIDPPNIPRLGLSGGARGAGIDPTGQGLTPGFQHGTPLLGRDMWAFLHKGEGVLNARDNRLLSLLAGRVLAAPRAAQGGNLSVPIALTVNAQTWDEARRLSHERLDQALSSSRSRIRRRGTTLSPSIG